MAVGRKLSLSTAMIVLLMLGLGLTLATVGCGGGGYSPQVSGPTMTGGGSGRHLLAEYDCV